MRNAPIHEPPAETEHVANATRVEEYSTYSRRYVAIISLVTKQELTKLYHKHALVDWRVSWMKCYNSMVFVFSCSIRIDKTRDIFIASNRSDHVSCARYCDPTTRLPQSGHQGRPVKESYSRLIINRYISKYNYEIIVIVWLSDCPFSNNN